jgi:hypothetical protein
MSAASRPQQQQQKRKVDDTKQEEDDDEFVYVNPHTGKRVKKDGPTATAVVETGQQLIRYHQKVWKHLKLQTPQVDAFLRRLPNVASRVIGTPSKTIPNAGNGDCFFLAIQQALPSETTVTSLRNMVASVVTQAELDVWHMELELGSELHLFMAGVVTVAELQERIRQPSTKNTKSWPQEEKKEDADMEIIFWGEEFSIVTLEQALKIVIVVVDHIGQCFFAQRHGCEIDDVECKGVVYLLAKQNHFEVLKLQDSPTLLVSKQQALQYAPFQNVSASASVIQNTISISPSSSSSSNSLSPASNSTSVSSVSSASLVHERPSCRKSRLLDVFGVPVKRSPVDVP